MKISQQTGNYQSKPSFGCERCLENTVKLAKKNIPMSQAAEYVMNLTNAQEKVNYGHNTASQRVSLCIDYMTATVADAIRNGTDKLFKK